MLRSEIPDSASEGVPPTPPPIPPPQAVELGGASLEPALGERAEEEREVAEVTSLEQNIEAAFTRGGLTLEDYGHKVATIGFKGLQRLLEDADKHKIPRQEREHIRTILRGLQHIKNAIDQAGKTKDPQEVKKAYMRAGTFGQKELATLTTDFKHMREAAKAQDAPEHADGQDVQNESRVDAPKPKPKPMVITPSDPRAPPSPSVKQLHTDYRKAQSRYHKARDVDGAPAEKVEQLRKIRDNLRDVYDEAREKETGKSVVRKPPPREPRPPPPKKRVPKGTPPPLAKRPPISPAHSPAAPPPAAPEQKTFSQTIGSLLKVVQSKRAYPDDYDAAFKQLEAIHDDALARLQEFVQKHKVGEDADYPKSRALRKAERPDSGLHPVVLKKFQADWKVLNDELGELRYKHDFANRALEDAVAASAPEPRFEGAARKKKSTKSPSRRRPAAPVHVEQRVRGSQEWSRRDPPGRLVQGERPRAGQLQEKPTVDAIRETMKEYGFMSGWGVHQHQDFMRKTAFSNPRKALYGSGNKLRGKLVVEYQQWREELLGKPGKRAPPALEDLLQWPAQGHFGRSRTPERGVEGGTGPKARSWLTNQSKLGEERMQLMRQMFSDRDGFGNPANLAPKAKRDRGNVSRTQMRKYVKAFVPNVRGVNQMSDQQLFQVLAGTADSPLQQFRRILGPASGGRGAQHTIERFFAHERGPEASARQLVPPTPIELTMPPLEKAPVPKPVERPGVKKARPVRVLPSGVQLEKTDTTHGKPPATPAKEILDLTQEQQMTPEQTQQTVMAARIDAALLAADRRDAERRARRGAPPAMPVRARADPDDEKDPRHEAAPRREAAPREARRLAPMFNMHQIRHNLRVENAPQGVIGHTSYTHTIEGDIAPDYPAIGRVHLVGLGPLVGDEESRHFLAEMDADSNMGAKMMQEAGRRGPFKMSSGSSRIMDRSAHVLYRRRGLCIEITVHRGVSTYELDTLLGKLGAHRMSTVRTQLFFIDGRRKKLGLLDNINLEKLRDKIHKTLDKKRQIGIAICDERQRGIMHKADGHERGMKASMRAGQLSSALL